MGDRKTGQLAALGHRLPSVVARLEPLFILALAPLLMFPRPSWMPWLLAALALLWLVRWLANGRLTARTPLDGPMLALVVMIGVSMWATFDLTTSFPKLAGLTLGIALFYALVNALHTERTVWLATGLLLLGGAAVAVVSLVGVRWGSSKVSILAPFLARIYARLPLLITDVPRAEKGFNANQVGGALVLFIPLAATLLLYQLRRSRHRPSLRRDVPWILTTLGLCGTLAFTLFVLLLTQSRGSYVATALALLLAFATQGRWPSRVAIAVLVVGLVLLAHFGVQRTGEALFGIGSLESLSQEASWAGRVEFWKRSLRVLQDHPFTGIGFDTLFAVIHARYPTFLLPPGTPATHAHNFLLQVGLDLGIPGLVAFVWLLMAWGRMLWRVWREAESPAYRALATGLACGLLGHLVFGLTDANDLGAKPGVFMWAYFGLGAALWVKTDGAREPTGQPVTARRASAAARPLSALVLLLLVVWGYAQLARLQTWRSLLETDLANWQALALDGPQAIAPWQPEELLHMTHSDLQSLQAESAPLLALASHMRWLPGYGADLHATPALLQMGINLSAAGEQVLNALQPLLDGSTTADTGTLGLTVTTLQDAQPQLTAALATLAKVRQTRRTISTDRLSSAMKRWVTRLDQTLLFLEDGLQGAIAIPGLLGSLEPLTYLILIQNDDELRPTGGFISGVARAVLDRGRVVELTFADSYAVDDFSQPYPTPPRPLREIMGAEMWVFRDSNWSPDFPTSAQAALELYRLHNNAEIDGVVAVDQRALRLLVTALEPLDVVEYPEPLTSENVIRALRHSWAPAKEEGLTQEWWQQRKDFMGRLLSAVVNKLHNEPGQINPAELGWSVLRALEEKHLFVYLTRGGPAAQMLHQAGWDGALLDTQDDYLMVVDANLGFNKVNPFITESLSYTVDLRDPDQPQAILTLVHRHAGPKVGAPCRHEARYDLTYEEMMQGCYWDYIRVYVPQGSRPLEATPHPVPASMLLTRKERGGQAELVPYETGKTVFASFLVLGPGEQKETRFVYDLPAAIIEEDGQHRRYRLHIQKQGGTDANEVRITLLLPSEARELSVYPVPNMREGDSFLYELQLETDLDIEFRFNVHSGAD